MFEKVNVPLLGIIENMSYFVCPNCSARHEIFSFGGGEQLANDLQVPFFGRIPLEGSVREAGFVRPADFSPEKFFANALGVLGGERDYQVVIRFSAAVAAAWAPASVFSAAFTAASCWVAPVWVTPRTASRRCSRARSMCWLATPPGPRRATRNSV